MNVSSGWSTDADADSAAREAFGRLKAACDAPLSLLVVHATVAYPPEALVDALRALAPGVPIHGGSTCAGVMTQDGFHGEWGIGLGLFGLHDPSGAYGVGAAVIGDSPERAASAACAAALARAGRPGEVPAVVLMSAAAGAEERLLSGVEAFFGPRVVVVGGTAGDMFVGEDAWQLTDAGVHRGAVAIAALFTSGECVGSFHNGYEPTDRRGRVTRADGRTVFEIDGRPASEVYDAWTGGLATRWAETGGGEVVADITLHPIGRVIGRAGGLPYHLLAHPQRLDPSGALSFLTTLPEGEEIVLMRGSRETLTTRAGRVVRSALESGDVDLDDVAGGLVVYCAGCMLTVYDRMAEVAESVRAAMPDRPFLGFFVLGEQGCFPGGENRHGNQMICASLFVR